MNNLEPNLTEQLFDDTNNASIAPLDLFENWLSEATETEVNDPNAMYLATVDADGLPDVRAVLLNGRDDRGFVFFTNFESAKGTQLLAHPKAALLFHWKSRRRQVRIRGEVEEVSIAEADAYFDSRPRGSRIGAHASAQSRPLVARSDLEERVATLGDSFGEEAVPRPAYWSGFRIKPLQIEFWQDGAFRLHDRVLFRRENVKADWTHARLNP